MRLLLYSTSLLIFGALLSGCFNFYVETDWQRVHLDRAEVVDVVAEDVDPDIFQRDYPGADGVYLYREHVFEHIGGSQTGMSSNAAYGALHIRSERYLILNPDNQRLSTFDYTLHPGQSLGEAYITIVSPNGDVQQFDKEDLREDPTPEGGSRYRLAYPNIVKGSIVDEGFEVFGSSYSEGPFQEMPLQFTLPCRYLEVVYMFPTNWKYIVSITDPREVAEGLVKSVRKEHGREIVRYSGRDIPAYDRELYAPHYRHLVPYVQSSITSFRFALQSFEPGPENWKKVAERLHRSLLGGEEPGERFLKKRLRKIIDEEDEPEQIIRKVVTWVQKSIRVDDSRGNESILTTLADRQGTTNRVTGLAQLLLQTAGINARTVMTRSSLDGPLDSTIFHPATFYEPVLIAETEDTLFYAYPAIRNYPLNQLRASHQGESALRLDEERRGEIELLSYNSEPARRKEFTIMVEIEEGGDLLVAEKRAYHAEDGYAFRRYLEPLTESERNEFLRKELRFGDGELQDLEIVLSNLDQYGDPLEILFTYRAGDLTTFASDEVIVQADLLFSPIGGEMDKVDEENRVYPVAVYQDEMLLQEISISYPSSWSLVELPSDFSEESRFGMVQQEFADQNGTLIITERRQLNRSEGEASEFPALLKLVQPAEGMSIPALVFSKR